MFAVPLHRVILAALALLAPLAAVVAVLVVTEQVHPAPALIALVGATIGPAVAIAVFYADFGGVISYVRVLGESGEGLPAPVPQLNSDIARALIGAVDGLERSHQLHRAGADHARGVAEAVLDHLPQPLLLIGRDRTVARLNREAERLLGAQALHRPVAEVLVVPELVAAVEAVLAGAPSRTIEVALPTSNRIHQAELLPFAPPALPPVLRAVKTEGRAMPIAALLSLTDVTRLRRSEQMRDDFVANISHELRTPLATLIGFIETLQGAAREDPAAREHFLGIMHEQANRMARLVSELLALSRLELQLATPPEDRVRLAAVVERVLASLQLKVQARAMGLTAELEGDLPALVGDEEQLMRVFQNLVDNALSYAEPGTPVRVRLGAVEGGWQRVDVEDQGPGIAREHLPRLTERFYRVDPARGRNTGGTGLGLAIVKQIVERHRGRLEIDSQPGRGSRFTVLLPPG